MKTLYFDCSSGISGNMTLAALLEIIGDDNVLLEELKKLNVDGYKIEISKMVKNGITGKHVDVIIDGEEHDHHNHDHEHHHEHDNAHHHEDDHEHHHEHEHEHAHHHEHRNLNDVNKIIDSANIDEKTKALAKRIFLRVANAESKVHNKPLDEVHFHEVGAIDSIVDIIGTAILINKINPDKIVSSIVNDGYGFIECAHGKIPVPVPATSEIFAASNVKFRQINIDTELVTPTGAAIIAELASEFINLPAMNVEKIGWGAGTKELEIPNVLKVYYGETEENEEDFAVLETNIDDSTGEILGFVQEKLFSEGALDVFFTPIFMKKSRPAYRLTVCCKRKDIEKMQNILFTDTTTIGIRYRFENRTVLSREIIDMNTKYGTVKVKKVINNNQEYFYPEFESLKKISLEQNIPLKELYKLDEFKGNK